MNAARDLVGYGATPPAAQWPGSARIAVQFVVNYEEGAENCVLNGDAGSEAFLSKWSVRKRTPVRAPWQWKACTNTAAAPVSGGCIGCLPHATYR